MGKSGRGVTLVLKQGLMMAMTMVMLLIEMLAMEMLAMEMLATEMSVIEISSIAMAGVQVKCADLGLVWIPLWERVRVFLG